MDAGAKEGLQGSMSQYEISSTHILSSVHDMNARHVISHVVSARAEG